VGAVTEYHPSKISLPGDVLRKLTWAIGDLEQFDTRIALVGEPFKWPELLLLYPQWKRYVQFYPKKHFSWPKPARHWCQWWSDHILIPDRPASYEPEKPFPSSLQHLIAECSTSEAQVWKCFSRPSSVNCPSGKFWRPSGTIVLTAPVYNQRAPYPSHHQCPTYHDRLKWYECRNVPTLTISDERHKCAVHHKPLWHPKENRQKADVKDLGNPHLELDEFLSSSEVWLGQTALPIVVSAGSQDHSATTWRQAQKRHALLGAWKKDKARGWEWLDGRWQHTGKRKPKRRAPLEDFSHYARPEHRAAIADVPAHIHRVSPKDRPTVLKDGTKIRNKRELGATYIDTTKFSKMRRVGRLAEDGRNLTFCTPAEYHDRDWNRPTAYPGHENVTQMISRHQYSVGKNDRELLRPIPHVTIKTLIKIGAATKVVKDGEVAIKVPDSSAVNGSARGEIMNIIGSNFILNQKTWRKRNGYRPYVAHDYPPAKPDLIGLSIAERHRIAERRIAEALVSHQQRQSEKPRDSEATPRTGQRPGASASDIPSDNLEPVA
jgi:hypothetical protein